MAAEDDNSGAGKVDAVSILYVLGGIPAMVLFFVLLFTLGAKGCSLPA